LLFFARQNPILLI
ncbi:membrane-bound lytic murein transglycosylase D domain protein, partial [Vibrio parahaemolyticus V-223/04]